MRKKIGHRQKCDRYKKMIYRTYEQTTRLINNNTRVLKFSDTSKSTVNLQTTQQFHIFNINLAYEHDFFPAFTKRKNPTENHFRTEDANAQIDKDHIKRQIK